MQICSVFISTLAPELWSSAFNSFVPRRPTKPHLATSSLVHNTTCQLRLKVQIRCLTLGQDKSSVWEVWREVCNCSKLDLVNSEGRVLQLAKLNYSLKYWKLIALKLFLYIWHIIKSFQMFLVTFDKFTIIMIISINVVFCRAWRIPTLNFTSLKQ